MTMKRRAIQCPIHGFQILTYQQFKNQMTLNLEDQWQCPIKDCDTKQPSIEFYQESLDDGCCECDRSFQDTSKIIYSHRILGLFCSQECHDSYMAKLKRAHIISSRKSRKPKLE